MLVDGTTQTKLGLSKRALGERIFREGIEIWKRQQELAKLKKLREQQEIREMFDSYYPFGHATDMKPRGLRNLRLEGIFPNRDYLNAKRFVGTLELGSRPVGGGGGAPLMSDTGKKVTRTHEDPLLRFQFGSHDLRRCVDNTLRYKTNKKAQEDYKKELDKLVEEKRKNEERQRIEDLEFEQKQGWSTENTLKKLDSERTSETNNYIHKDFEKPKSVKKVLTNKVRKLNPIFYPCKNVYVGSKNRKLSPLPEGKENGIELVPLLAKQRRFPVKIHLDTTDVTNQKKINLSSFWNRQGSSYLRELTQQMVSKQQKLKEMKAEDDEIVQHHFSTLDGFWGRPGHGAPKSAVKKQRLDRLLYPQMVPISTHFFIMLLVTTYAKEDESNEVTPPHPPVKLDSNLRRALLKALTELENEENEKNSRLDTREKIIEKASASALSFVASTDSSSSVEKLSTTTAKPIVVIQRSNGLQHRPITTIEKFGIDPVSDAEQILTSASSSFSSNKFPFTKTETQASSNLLSNNLKSTAKFVRPVKTETTTVTTTTSTEESEAKVEDVQFFSAPLVAAFTPSITLTSSQQQSGLLPLNAQQLPVKNAIDFRSPFTSQTNFHQFNYLSQQQPPLVNSVPNFNLVPTVQPQLTLTAPKHHRVFRQEANTGNFFSNGFNHFNPPHQQSSNRFFRSNVETTPYNFNSIQPPIVNQHLNNLLYNSGIIR
ncbi:uncharacterized protein BDFB_002220, partial [Asbolus verrucosus]